MSSEPLESNEQRAQSEAVETFKAHELAAMTDERAREIIQTLRAAGLVRPRRTASNIS